MILKRKIFLRVSGLLAAMIVAVAGLSCVFAVEHHRASVKDVFGAQLAVLSDRAEGLVLWDDRVALRDMLLGMVRDHEVVEYAFIERRGRPFIHTFERGVPEALLGLPTGAAQTLVLRELEDEHGRRFFDMAVSVGDEQAVIHLGLSSEAIDRQVLGEVLTIAGLGLAAIAVGVVLAGVTARLITREVDQAADALRAEISERRRAEEALSRYRDGLEELVQQRTRALEESQAKMRQAERLASIGTFAAGVAHEVNNPLASILMTARHALKSEHERGAVETLLKEIIEDTERCARIVKGILLFAKHQPSDKRPVNLNDIVQRARDLIREYADRRGVRLELEASDHLPTVLGNATQLVQVFVNVISNAIEASHAGQTVAVQTERKPDRIRVRVEDHGRGMIDEERQCAFDPFFTTRTKEGGTGLGLSVVHGTVTEHGGMISIDTAPGRGTTVAIEFPLDGSSANTRTS